MTFFRKLLYSLFALRALRLAVAGSVLASTLSLGIWFGSARSDEAGADPDSARSASYGPPKVLRTAVLSPSVARIERLADLPRVLSAGDVIRYRRIFKIQDAADWVEADALIDKLDDDVLMGHVLYQRYMHPTGYKSNYAELTAWLKKYADQPRARRLHRLALKRRPKDAPAPRKPPNDYLGGIGEDEILFSTHIPKRKLSKAQRATVKRHQDEIRGLIRDGKPTKASQVLARKGLIDLVSEAQYDALKGAIARGYLAHGKNKLALKFAAAAADRSGDLLPGNHWTAGLAAWRLDDLGLARHHFEALAVSNAADAYLVAGGAYWAARVHGLTRQPLLANRMLRIAADYPRTIYGLLAKRSLGEKPNFVWDASGFTQAETDILMKSTRTRRAMALAEVGQQRLAEQEIRKLYPKAGRVTGRALLKLTEHLDLPALQIRIGSKQAQADGRRHDRALYPVPGWAPKSGFKVDRALLYALVRQESGFDPHAKSYRGARGLMQLMPGTATYIDGETRYHGDSADALFDPVLSLELGQKYVDYLLNYDGIDGNVIYMLAAYNAGPGNLKKWLRAVDHGDDPLLFVESIPSLETRRFVRRVLTNLWIYRNRLDQDATTLSALAAGRWPNYAGLDDTEVVAQLGGN